MRKLRIALANWIMPSQTARSGTQYIRAAKHGDQTRLTVVDGKLVEQFFADVRGMADAKVLHAVRTFPAGLTVTDR